MNPFFKILFLSFFFWSCEQSSFAQNQISEEKSYNTYHQAAEKFAKEKGYNQDIYFLVDLGVHPGIKRMYIYDFKEQKILKRAMVSHGAYDVVEPNEQKWEEARFSNVVNSHCSSLGKYQLGSRDSSGWGIGVKYWLKGLEASNNNAQKRIVVLHSWEAIPDEETYPKPIALSWGCPAVSNNVMREIDALIQDQDNKKILYWIIDSEEN